MSASSPARESRAAVYNWLLSGVWLLFLASPLLAIFSDDDLGQSAKIGAVALLAGFCVIYIHGFYRLDQANRHRGVPGEVDQGGSGVGDRSTVRALGLAHFVGLVTVTVVLYAMVGLAALGVIPFVVAFAVFHFSWPVTWLVYGIGIGLTFLLPFASGALDDLWFLTLIVLAVGGVTILIRVVDEQEARRAVLQTELAVSDERSRVARDVHDVLGHSLTAVILKAELCQRLLDESDSGSAPDQARIEACREQLAELTTVSRSALAEIRSTVGGLRIADLADEVTVARSVLADAGVSLLVTGEASDIPEQYRSMLAWVVREAITNIVRHAQATQCQIELGSGGETRLGAETQPLLRISDNGVGFSQAASCDGNGLRGLRERVETAGATLTIESDGGTRIEVAL